MCQVAVQYTVLLRECGTQYIYFLASSFSFSFYKNVHFAHCTLPKICQETILVMTYSDSNLLFSSVFSGIASTIRISPLRMRIVEQKKLRILPQEKYGCNVRIFLPLTNSQRILYVLKYSCSSLSLYMGHGNTKFLPPNKPPKNYLNTS